MKEVIWFKISYAARKVLIGAFIIPILAFISITEANAEIYKWIDSNGVTYFSAYPPGKNNPENKTNESYENNYVIMYSASWCPVCRKARNYFNQNNIPFTEYDVEKLPNRMREYKRLGGTGYPLILIGDNKKMQGFSVGGFERRYYK